MIKWQIELQFQDFDTSNQREMLNLRTSKILKESTAAVQGYISECKRTLLLPSNLASPFDSPTTNPPQSKLGQSSSSQEVISRLYVGGSRCPRFDVSPSIESPFSSNKTNQKIDQTLRIYLSERIRNNNGCIFQYDEVDDVTHTQLIVSTLSLAILAKY